MTKPAGLPVEIGGHSVVGLLSGEGMPPTVEARGPGDRRIVLKGLDLDCLLKGGTVLHPNIRERLSRVRELALTGVANFLGVCRDTENGYDGYAAWLMWEYVEGETLNDYAAASSRSDRDLMNATRELILTIDSLHLQGIVHGSIKGSNVLIDRSGAIRLTHVSPLLYNDLAEDAQSTVEMLWSIVQARGSEETPFGVAVNEAVEALPTGAQAALRQLGARLAATPEQAIQTELTGDFGPARTAGRDPWPRRRALLAATAISILGFVAAYGIWTAVGRPALPLPRQVQDTIDGKWGK